MIRENLFSRAADVEELFGNMVGAASMAWEDVRLAGTFDTEWAGRVVADGLARLEELQAGD